MNQNIKTQYFKVPFESLIPRARNVCVSAFMKSDCTHMIFIDADIEFNPYDVIKLINHNKEIIGGIYPTKAINEQKFIQCMKEDINKTFKEVITSSVNYTSVVQSKGVNEYKYIGTGFMMIQRELIKRLMQQNPDLKYKNNINAYKMYEYENGVWDLFQTKIKNGIYLSEDYGFCELCKENQVKIFADTSIKLNHIGQMKYYGNPEQN